MKYCPYCGAELAKAEAPFCAECGESLTGAVPEPDKAEHNTRTDKKKIERGKHKTKRKSKRRHIVSEIPLQPVDETEARSADDGYDGYYDDVLPADEGSHREGIDKELIKKIVALTVGALIIVAACVALMYLL